MGSTKLVSKTPRIYFVPAFDHIILLDVRYEKRNYLSKGLDPLLVTWPDSSLLRHGAFLCAHLGK